MKQQNEFELRPCEFMGSNLTWSVDVVVASTIEAISPAVDQLMQSLKTSCSPPEQEIDVEMALREALANAIVHGNHEDLHKKVRVCCACDAKRGMLIVVKDQGEGFDPSKIPSPLAGQRSEEHTSELQSRLHLVCRLLLDTKNAARPARADRAHLR